jgi:hypothetical protein
VEGLDDLKLHTVRVWVFRFKPWAIYKREMGIKDKEEAEEE